MSAIGHIVGKLLKTSIQTISWTTAILPIVIQGAKLWAASTFTLVLAWCTLKNVKFLVLMGIFVAFLRAMLMPLIERLILIPIANLTEYIASSLLVHFLPFLAQLVSKIPWVPWTQIYYATVFFISFEVIMLVAAIAAACFKALKWIKEVC